MSIRQICEIRFLVLAKTRLLNMQIYSRIGQKDTNSNKLFTTYFGKSTTARYNKVKANIAKTKCVFLKSSEIPKLNYI